MNKIIVIASINMDIVSRIEKYPRSGETIRSKNFSYIPGGKGANQAVAAHRLGGNVWMLGKIGKDAFGKSILQFFRKERINTNNIVIADKISTGAAFVAIDNSSENIIYVSGGANDDLSFSDIKKVQIKKGDIVLATLETPIEATKQLFGKAKKIGAKTILNAAPAILDAETIFPLTDYLIVNETELSIFTRTKIPKSVKDAVALLRKLKSGTTNAITTLGKKGVVALVAKETIFVKGRKVKAVDTTAAGDCFVGAFAVAIQEDKIIKEAINFANAAAAISVQRLGTSSSLPTRKEVENFISK